MSRQKIAGVIFSGSDLQRALRMRNPPDFFELRLDRLISCLDELRDAVGRLAAPLIVTARDPREGGANNLSTIQRRTLLFEFLPRAQYVDVEVRSANALRSVVRAAADRKINTIISFHDLRSTPRPSQLDKIAERARSLGAAIVKVATRTDTPAQLDRLLDFFDRQRDTPVVVAMGMGKLGRRSRLLLAKHDCPLNYAHLGSAGVLGQLSVSELRRALG